MAIYMVHFHKLLLNYGPSFFYNSGQYFLIGYLADCPGLIQPMSEWDFPRSGQGSAEPSLGYSEVGVYY